MERGGKKRTSWGTGVSYNTVIKYLECMDADVSGEATGAEQARVRFGG